MALPDLAMHIAPLARGGSKSSLIRSPMPAGRLDSVSAMSNVTPPLQGRRILVTGAATGIGAAAVRVLTEAGAEIVATYHQTPPPDDLVATWLQCDARDPDAVSTTVQQAAEHLGGLDVLVNAAGLWQAGIPGYIGADDISFLLDTNVKATILTNQAAYAVMKEDPKAAGSSTSDPPKPLWAARSRPSTPRRRARFRRGPDPPPSAWAADNVTVNALAPAVQTPGRRPTPRFPRSGGRWPHRPADENDDPARRGAGRSRARCRTDPDFSGRSWFGLHYRATARGGRRLDHGGRLTAVHA